MLSEQGVMYDDPGDLDEPADVDLDPRAGRGVHDLGQEEVGTVDRAAKVGRRERGGGGRPRAVVADRGCVGWKKEDLRCIHGYSDILFC